MWLTFSKRIDFNGDMTRVFFFSRIVDEDLGQIAYLVSTHEDGYLTAMIQSDFQWKIMEPSETPLFCLGLEREFRQAIEENKTK